MKTVNYYDPTTKSVTEIPASELSPGCVTANVEGVDGRVFVSLPEFNLRHRFRHEPFEGKRLEICHILAKILQVPCQQTPQEWEHSFRCDKHPDREQKYWLSIATAYVRLTNNKHLSRKVRHDYFQVILSCANNTPQYALEPLCLRAITHETAKAIIRYLDKEESFQSMKPISIVREPLDEDSF